MESVASSARAMPRSITLGPSGPNSTLPGRRSPWTVPAWWMATSAVIVPTASRWSAAASRTPPEATVSSSVGPSMYSLTMYGLPSSTPLSRTWAVQKAGISRSGSIASRNRSRSTSAGSSRTTTRSPEGDLAR